jgi:hypothetical protein
MGSGDLATRSFKVIVLGVAGLFALVALGSVLLGVRTNRTNEGENPPTYDCGSPASFITGSSRQSWSVADSTATPTTVRGSEVASTTTPDFRMTDACPKAMAPRLGFTVWVLALGLVVTTMTALALPAAAAADQRHGE